MIVADVISYLEKIAPPGLAMPGDSIGLQVGDASASVTRIATAVDVTRDVIDKASSIGANLLVSHHPLIHKSLETITASHEKGELVMRAVKAGLAVYVMHTNLDSAPGGINDTLAEAVGLVDMQVLTVVSTEPYFKVVVFVPDEAVDGVRAAMCGAGGFVGNYSDCSFRTKGIGTFKPLEGAQPYIGKTGELEQTEEWRLETLAPESTLPEVIQAMLKAHPYEEVAYDVYPLQNERKKSGLGLVGRLQEPERLSDLRSRVEQALDCPGFTRISGDAERAISTIAVWAGGGGAAVVPDAAGKGADLFLTGELGHHGFLTAEWHGMAVIDAGHFNAEKPGMLKLTEMLLQKYAQRSIGVTYVDR